MFTESPIPWSNTTNNINNKISLNDSISPSISSPLHDYQLDASELKLKSIEVLSSTTQISKKKFNPASIFGGGVQLTTSNVLNCPYYTPDFFRR